MTDNCINVDVNEEEELIVLDIFIMVLLEILNLNPDSVTHFSFQLVRYTHIKSHLKNN